MRSPQLEDGFYQLAYELSAAFAMAGFTRNESIILDEVRSAIFGHAKKDTVKISPTEIAKQTGLSRGAISNSLSMLIRQNVLVRHGDEVTLNKIYQTWVNADGSPLFDDEASKYIALAPARAIYHKLGHVPQKTVDRIMTTFGGSESEAFDFDKAAPDRGATPKRGAKEKLRHQIVAQEIPAQHQIVARPYKGTCAMDKENNKYKNPPLPPLEPEPVRTGAENELPPGSDVVIQKAESLWQMGNPSLAGHITRKLLQKFQNAALVLFAIEQANAHARGGKVQLVEAYALKICENNAEGFKNAKPPVAPKPEPVIKPTYASPEREARIAQLKADVEARSRRRAEDDRLAREQANHRLAS